MNLFGPRGIYTHGPTDTVGKFHEPPKKKNCEKGDDFV
jgi:hypothetical protein